MSGVRQSSERRKMRAGCEREMLFPNVGALLLLCK